MAAFSTADFVNEVGNKLRNLRKEKGLSQETLAFNAGIPTNQIGRIERGEITTSIGTLYAIAKVLEIEPMQLLDVMPKG